MLTKYRLLDPRSKLTDDRLSDPRALTSGLPRTRPGGGAPTELVVE